MPDEFSQTLSQVGQTTTEVGKQSEGPGQLGWLVQAMPKSSISIVKKWVPSQSWVSLKQNISSV
jgi:hypothetical protein